MSSIEDSTIFQTRCLSLDTIHCLMDEFRNYSENHSWTTFLFHGDVHCSTLVTSQCQLQYSQLFISLWYCFLTNQRFCCHMLCECFVNLRRAIQWNIFCLLGWLQKVFVSVSNFFLTFKDFAQKKCSQLGTVGILCSILFVW